MEVLQESAWGVRLGGFWLPAGGNVQPIITMHLANDKQPFPPALNYKITKKHLKLLLALFMQFLLM
jgi:hypothetical protein